MSSFTTGRKGYIRYLRPLALFAEQVSVSIRLPPILFKGVGPHQLPVTQVVNLTPLLLCGDTCQELLLGLWRNPDLCFQFSFYNYISCILKTFSYFRQILLDQLLPVLTNEKFPLSKAILAM